MKTGIVAFFAGILALYRVPVLPDSYWIFLIIPLVVPLILKPSLRLVVLFIFGFLWALFRADQILIHQLPQTAEGKDLTITGTITGLPHQSWRREQFLFNVDSINDPDLDQTSTYRFKLNWYDDYAVVQPGERWRLIVRVKRPNGFMNPGGKDYEANLFRQGINASGYVKKGEKIRQKSIPFLQRVHHWRSKIYRDLKSSLPKMNGIIPAIGLGIRDDLTANVWNVLSLTGTIHLTAISGLHIGLIAALAFLIGRWLWSLPVITIRWLPATKMGAIFAIVAALVYAALAGFSIPTQRALIMVLVIMLCFLSNRQLSRFDIFSIALFSVLLFSPASVISPGFWLSFTAVAIIFYTLSGRTPTGGFWHTSLKVHFILALGLSPFLLMLFGQNPLLGPLANILAVPFFALFITPLVLSGILLLYVFKPFGEGLLKLADYLIDLFWPILEWIADLPHTHLIGSISSIAVLMISLIGILILLMPKGLPGRWLAGIFILPVFLIHELPPDRGDYQFTLFDVGQGLAVVIRTRNHVLLYDTGAKFSDNFDTGKAVVLPYLRSLGLKSLDKVIISHGDNDHRGGYQSVAKKIPIIETLTSVPEKIHGKNIHLCESGQHWKWDNVNFEILHPGRNYKGTGNNRSCVLKIDNGYKSVLLTGDIEASAEALLIRAKHDKLDSDLLVVPHHGSKTSSTAEFIAAISPEYALFPVGYRNRFNHPAKIVYSRYHGANIKLLDTTREGTIQFMIGKTISAPDRYRYDHGHFWNRNLVE